MASNLEAFVTCSFLLLGVSGDTVPTGLSICGSGNFAQPPETCEKDIQNTSSEALVPSSFLLLLVRHLLLVAMHLLLVAGVQNT